MRRVQLVDVQREKDKAPNLTWEHMASTSARTVKVATYQDERFGSNNLLDHEPRGDDLKSFADRSCHETAMVKKITGTATGWKSQLPSKANSQILQNVTNRKFQDRDMTEFVDEDYC